MSRRSLVFSCLVLTLCCAAFATDVVTIYNGQAVLPPTIKVADWGNDGKGTDPIKPVSVKSSVYGIPVNTLSRYQGIRFDINPPVDSAKLFGTQDTFVEMYIRALLPENASTTDKTRAKMPEVSNIYLTFFTQKGIGMLTVPSSQLSQCEFVQGAWFKIDVPLSQLSAKTPVGGTLNRLVISSDQSASFLLGRLAFVQDISTGGVNISTFPAVLETEKPIFFTVETHGASDVSWDFDTASGATVDATGDRVLYTYTNPGTYTVTCTVRNAASTDPVTVTREIRVVRPEN